MAGHRARRSTVEQRTQLQTRRRDLMFRLSMLESTAGRFKGYAPPDETDQAVEGAEDELVLRLLEMHSGEIVDVEDAMDRLRRGKYGFCEHCGRRIPAARLRLMPAARYCIDCQSAAERERGEGDSSIDWSSVEDMGAGDRKHSAAETISGSKF